MLGTIAPIATALFDFSGIVSALNAAAKTLNASGGINGHPVKTWSCNVGTTPDQVLACARKAVAAKVSAVIGANVAYVGKEYEAILAKAHIVDLAATGLIPEAYSAPNAYSLTLEIGTWAPCAGAGIAKATGGKSVIVVSNVGDAADSVVDPVMEATAKAAGLKWLGVVKVPASVSDWAPYVAQAQAKGADIAIPAAIGAGPQAFVRASSAAGAKYAICTALGLSGQGGWTGVGAAEKNIYVGASFAPLNGQNATASRLEKSFADERATGDKFADVSPQKLLPAAVLTWLGVDTFQQIAKGISGTVDAASFEAAIPTGKATYDGLLPDIDFSKISSGGFYPRVFNSGAFLWKWSPTEDKYTLTASMPDTLSTAFPKK